MSKDNSFKINYLLTPLSFLYGIGVKIRNLLFDWGILPSVEYPVPVISIGNLTVGGTGKTPHTEYLIRFLEDNFRVAVLSRGYKRATTGFILASEESTSQTIGDEPYQMMRKFPDIIVAVDSNRRRGIQNLLSLPKDEKPDVILLDDAFQHRYVNPSLSILTTDYYRLFNKDALLPAGRLREPKSGRNRADIIIVTKCPTDLAPINFRIVQEEMKLLTHQKVFFTCIKYEQPEPVFQSGDRDLFISRNIEKEDEILLVAGIASADRFVEEVNNQSDHVTTMIFPDHHEYDQQDIRKINEAFDKLTGTDKYFLTTEKDAVRLLNNPYIPEEWKEILFYLPIKIGFINQPEISLGSLVEKHIVTLRHNIIIK